MRKADTRQPVRGDQRRAPRANEKGAPPSPSSPSPLPTAPRNPRTLHTQLRVGDRVRLKKPHPCGSSEWEVLRLGAEVKFRCTHCGRIVSLPRAQLATALKAILGRATGGGSVSAGEV